MKAFLRFFTLLFALLRGAFKAGSEVVAEHRPRKRIVEETQPDPRSELVVIWLLLAAGVAAVAFIVIYGVDAIGHRTQFLGLALGGSLLLIATALILMGKRLVPEEELSEEYSEGEPSEQEKVLQIIEESGSGFTRKRLLLGAGGVAGGALGLAAITPLVSTGPVFDMESFYDTPWHHGRRLVDEAGKPLSVDEIEENTFYSAFPEHQPREQVGAPLIVVRLPQGDLKLPSGRANWAVDGIVAYSKICTHAGCAINLYRKPLFTPTQPRPALVCPCHYSTFDPATGGDVIFGPAGRPLPQLPLYADSQRNLRAAANFDEAVGPSWWGVRMGKASNPK